MSTQISAAATTVATASTHGRPDESASSRARKRRPRSSARIVVYVVLTLAVLVTMAPFVWMYLGSVKTQQELVRRPPTWWPESFTWDNFVTWFTKLDFGTFFFNSVVVAGFTVLGTLLFCSMVGYALAKLQFPGKSALFVLVLVTLMVPGVVTFIPLFVVISNLGLVSTYPALILPFLAGPLGVFLMRQFIGEIPDSLIEAARIDGAGEMRIFATIVLPLCKPALATLAILTFLGSWNNFLWPLVVAQSERMYTLPVALSLYSVGQNATNYGVLLAGSVLVITPVLLMFIALQKYFIQGIAMTGIK
ncbi:carbohydrate ABC transporter permease [Microbacterium sp. 22215]|uniref:carbohydrate ABC transporter permease n=1 Tax=Microbacterium sp. 22215 TaxID=3453893 RepID=UPI003F830229